MAEPRDIIDFDTITPVAADYLIVQRDETTGGKATIANVVAASRRAPYTLIWDSVAVTGSGKTYTIPANTLSANGMALRIEVVASKPTAILADEVDIDIGSINWIGVRDGVDSRMYFEGRAYRTSPTQCMAAQSSPIHIASGVLTLSWSSAQSVQITTHPNVTIQTVRIVVEP